jgi:essential nuclear protein 1
VLKRVSLPALHAAAALLRLASLPYAGTTSFFVRVLLDKRYALPYRVVDGLVDHFTSFRADARQLPVVWHQSLLCFVQRYGHEVRDEDREGLKALCRVQYHHAVTPEVQRALAAAPRRGAAPPPATALRAVEDPGKLPPVELMEDD